jgi:1-acyl-sn-glycerol-3-phosphate acyltransferase
VQILFGWLVRLLCRTSRVGTDKIPPRGPVILASNHASFLDPLLVVASVRRPIFHVGKAYLFRNRWMNWFLENLGGQIPLDRGPEGGNQHAVAAGLRVLERGLALGIYPEGTRTLDGRLLPARTGVALFAFLSGAPVYPVALAGTFEAWPRHRLFPRLFRRTRVIVGDPIRVPPDPAAAEDPRRCLEFTDRVMNALAELLGQRYERRRRPADR